MSANKPITITVKLSRETKNTYRYNAIDEDGPVGNIYVQKKALLDIWPESRVRGDVF